MFRLSKADFRALRSDSKIVEADGPNIKVLRFPDGDYLKLFRRKRLISSAAIFPYSRRFCRNVKRLHALGVPTVEIQTLFRIPHLKCTAVRYSPLIGTTLREFGGPVSEELAERYGQFLAELHASGVYFRAVHPGNAVVLADGEFGLIDVGQLRIRFASADQSRTQQELFAHRPVEARRGDAGRYRDRGLARLRAGERVSAVGSVRVGEVRAKDRDSRGVNKSPRAASRGMRPVGIAYYSCITAVTAVSACVASNASSESDGVCDHHAFARAAVQRSGISQRSNSACNSAADA